MRLSTLPILLVSAVGTALAASDTLYTSSVSYCSDSRLIEIAAFDLAYHKSNSSITYSFSFDTTQSDLTVQANIYGNAYGIEVVDQTVNICDLLSGALCPLPSVNFTGYGTYPIDSSFVNDIPGIAWSIPNLEAYARIRLMDQTTNTEAACVLVTLSNGLSTYQPAVAIVTGIFALLALLVGIAHAALITSPSPAQYRWFDVLYLFQTAAATGFLSLNYPLLYVAFSENFHWAFSLFYNAGWQRQITNIRNNTGGHLSGTVSSGSGISTAGGEEGTNVNDLIDSIQALQNLTQGLSGTGLGGLFKRSTVALSASSVFSSNNSATSQTQYLWSYAGVGGYVSNLNIAPANAFATIFYCFLAWLAIAILFHIVLFLIVLPCAIAHQPWAIRLRRTWWQFTIGNALRICLMWSFPFWIFAFYQFKLGDSGLIIFLAVLALVVTFVPLLLVFIFSIIRSRRTSSTTAPGVSRLYTSYRWFHSAGTLYRPYRQGFHFFWFTPLILGLIVRSALIVFGSGAVASIGSTAVELIIFISLLVTRPHKDRKGDWIGAILSFFRLLAWGLTIAFIPFINANPIIRAIIGFVIIVVFGIATIILFLGFILNIGYGYWWGRHANYRLEDGLEVERFVGSEPGTPRDAEVGAAGMRQHVDANNFVSGSFADENGITPQQRNSALLAESGAVAAVAKDEHGREGRASRMSNWSDSRAGDFPRGMTSPEMAYAEAADGRGQRPVSHTSRRTSGRTVESGEETWYTPHETPVGGAGATDGRYPRDHFFADGRY